LFEKRRNGEPFSSQDLTDLQMWFNLAWFAPEFQEGEVKLPDGSGASVHALIEKGKGYTRREIEEMVGEQLKIMKNIVQVHRGSKIAARSRSPRPPSSIHPSIDC
jgi:hypothetical protein